MKKNRNLNKVMDQESITEASSKKLIGRGDFLKKFSLIAFAAALLPACDKLEMEKEEKEEKGDGSGSGNLKLLKTIKYEGRGYDKFEYDNQDRITKISTFGVNGNLLQCISFHYSDNYYIVNIGERTSFKFDTKTNKVTKTSTGTIIDLFNGTSTYTSTFTYTMELNRDGLPVKVIFETGNTNYYQYQSRNLISNSFSHLTRSNEFKYDNKKSPLHNCKTPKTWFWTKIGFWGFWDHLLLLINQNNIIEAKFNAWNWPTVEKYEYSYDSDGFPTKCKLTEYHNISSFTQEFHIEFVYYENDDRG